MEDTAAAVHNVGEGQRWRVVGAMPARHCLLHDCDRMRHRRIVRPWECRRRPPKNRPRRLVVVVVVVVATSMYR